MQQQTRRCFAMMAGRSTRYAQSRFCGWTDPPIAVEGRQSVLSLRELLQNNGVGLPKVWFVSDRRRAIATFEIMTAGMHAPIVHITEALREINFGHYENLSWDEIPPDFQSHYDFCLHHPSELKFPGGEAFNDFCDRVTRGLLAILSHQGDNSDFGIIGHQGSMRIVFMVAKGQGPNEFFDDTPETGSGEWVSLSASDVASWRAKYMREFLDVG